MSPDPNGLQLPAGKIRSTHVQLPELAVQVTQIEILYSAIGVTRGIHVNNARGLAHPVPLPAASSIWVPSVVELLTGNETLK